jgi:hypothetical protein
MTILYPGSESIKQGDWNAQGSISRPKVLNPKLGDSSYLYIDANVGNSYTVRLVDLGPMTDGDSILKFRAKVLNGRGTIQVVATIRTDGEFSSGTDGYMFSSGNKNVSSEIWKTYASKLDDGANKLLAYNRDQVYVKLSITGVRRLANSQLAVSGLWIETPQTDGNTFTSLADAYPTIDQLVTVETYQGRTAQAKWNGQNWLHSDDSYFEYANDPLDCVSVKGWRL